MLLDHDGYIPTFAHITEGSRHEMTVAKDLSLPKGSIVAMDKAYVDYGLFERWSEQGVHFVTRLKSNAFHVSYDPKPIPPTKTHILSDEELALQPLYGSYDRKCKRPLRLVRVYNAQNDEVLELVTNIRHLSADTISEIYKERWQIELFFKALKQNLRTKTFVGTSSGKLLEQSAYDLTRRPPRNEGESSLEVGGQTSLPPASRSRQRRSIALQSASRVTPLPHPVSIDRPPGCRLGRLSS